MILAVPITGLPWYRSRAVLERTALTLGLMAFFIIGYFGVGLSTDPARARGLATPLDARIPFVPRSLWLYLWVFPAALIPVFVVRCSDLFRRTVLAYAIVIAVSLIVFVVFPVTSLGLRVDPATLDVSRPSAWAVKVLYDLDPLYNLFPSLHLSIATLVAFSAWKAAGRYGAVAFVGVGLVGVSLCTVKQHFLLDGLGGLALAAAAHALVLRPYRPPSGSTPAYSWRGPAAYLMLLVLVYAGFYAAFLWVS